MSDEKVKFGKMKAVGYICLAFAAALSVLIVFTDRVKAEEVLPLVYYWGGLGVTMLGMNAGKRIGGSLAQAKVKQ